MVVVRNKGGEFCAGSGAALVEFLLGKNRGEAGRIETDVELVAAVPFCLASNAGDLSGGVAWTFSTFDLDRFDERIDPAGWDVKQYLKNPVVEWAHRFDIPAIGKADGVYADAKGLHGSIIFNSKDYDPFGWAIGERVKNGVIRAGSVGFRVLEIEIPDKEGGKDGTSLIFRKQELLEFSICNVPANPYALAKMAIAKKADADMADMPSPFWGNIINKYQGTSNK